MNKKIPTKEEMDLINILCDTGMTIYDIRKIRKNASNPLKALQDKAEELGLLPKIQGPVLPKRIKDLARKEKELAEKVTPELMAKRTELSEAGWKISDIREAETKAKNAGIGVIEYLNTELIKTIESKNDNQGDQTLPLSLSPSNSIDFKSQMQEAIVESLKYLNQKEEKHVTFSLTAEVCMFDKNSKTKSYIVPLKGGVLESQTPPLSVYSKLPSFDEHELEQAIKASLEGYATKSGTAFDLNNKGDVIGGAGGGMGTPTAQETDLAGQNKEPNDCVEDFN